MQARESEGVGVENGVSEESMIDLDLETRIGLPTNLRVLLADYPREAWEADPNFAGLVAFWLQMHLGFRSNLALMRADVEAVLDGKMEAVVWAPRLVHVGGQFVSHLHGHHHIEDDHYFPLLVARERKLAQGFEILDRDHNALDGHIAKFVSTANGALQGVDVGKFYEHLTRLERFIERHLADEEDLIVPVILRHGERGIGG